jgi:hypothetical protein
MRQLEFDFNKFIGDICKREDEGRKRIEDHQHGQESLPQRKYNKLYRESWQNSTKIGRRK